MPSNPRSRHDVPPRRTSADDDAAAQRLRPEPHDVYHIALLLPSCTLDLEKDLRLGPPKYPNQIATISERQPSADEQPDNPPTSLRIGKSKDRGYGFNRLTLDISFLLLPRPLVFGHNLMYPFAGLPRARARPASWCIKHIPLFTLQRLVTRAQARPASVAYKIALLSFIPFLFLHMPGFLILNAGANGAR
jgi:hypothetical protein